MLPEDFYFNKVETENNNLYIPTVGGANVKIKMLPQQCNHCAVPECEKVCPVDAITISSDGIVRVNRDLCNSCNSCADACPFENIKLDPTYNRAAKCDLCEGRIIKGEEPFCVKSCPGKARKVGDLDDPNSEVSVLISTRNGYVLQPDPAIDTEPKCYYVPGE
jgi:tetrathionate reductase subunit B